MLNEMASDLNVLARDAARIARQNPRTADFTRNILQRALKEIVACFPVYRTYVDGAGAPTDAISNGRWLRQGGTRRMSIPASSTFCIAF
jgi:(1->4)-alpha-D-glucan 1-alpha-D-glucosylmutase